MSITLASPAASEMILPDLRYRSVFISDSHLGSAACQTGELAAFLQRLECEHLYLVGDMVDAWVGGRTTRWKPGQERALVALLQKASPSCRVYYTPGNHDAVMRRFIGIQVFSTSVEHSFQHRTADGRTFLVIHGDTFDKFVTKLKPIAVTLAIIHEAISRLNWTYNAIAERTNLPQSDFARMLKRRIKAMTEKATGFEGLLTEEARRTGSDGVICGHIHRPEMRQATDGIWYVNTGDWVENCTFVAERFDGTLELVYWRDLLLQRPGPEPIAEPESNRTRVGIFSAFR